MRWQCSPRQLVRDAGLGLLEPGLLEPVGQLLVGQIRERGGNTLPAVFRSEGATLDFVE